MTRLAQSVHVMLKDVRQARLPLLTYLAVVVVGIVRVVAMPTPSQAFVVTAPLLVLLGVIVMASVVQNDSPARANEFWTSRPFYPSAIIASKLLFGAATLIAVGLIGEFVALQLFDVHGSRAAGLMVDSARGYGCFLLGAIVLAALTQDIRAFVVATLLIGIGAASAYAAMPRGLETHLLRSPLSRPAFWVIAVAGGLALLTVTYRTLEVRRLTWAFASIIVAAIMALLFGVGEFAFPQAAVASTPPPITVSVQQPTINVATRRLRVQITASGGDSAARIAFDADSATIHFRNGSVARARSFGSFALLRAGNPGLPAGTRLLEPVGNRLNVDFNVTDAAVPAQEIESVDVMGRVWISDAAQVVSLPLSAGSRAARNGIRARVSKVQFVPGWSTFEIQTAQMVTATTPSPFYSSGLNVVAINDKQHEAIIAHSAATGGSTEWAVLPGAPINTNVATYTAITHDSTGDIVPRDSSWFNASRVSIVQWSPRATYPIRLSTSR